jgi:hypothetical protein
LKNKELRWLIFLAQIVDKEKEVFKVLQDLLVKASAPSFSVNN